MQGLHALVIPVIVVIMFLFSYLIPVRLWLAAMKSGARVSLATFVGMRLRRVPPVLIIEPLITAAQAGLRLDVRALEAHYLAGGSVSKLVNALVSAHRAGVELSFERAAASDLAGRSALDELG